MLGGRLRGTGGILCKSRIGNGEAGVSVLMTESGAVKSLRKIKKEDSLPQRLKGRISEWFDPMSDVNSWPRDICFYASS